MGSFGMSSPYHALKRFVNQLYQSYTIELFVLARRSLSRPLSPSAALKNGEPWLVLGIEFQEGLWPDCTAPKFQSFKLLRITIL